MMIEKKMPYFSPDKFKKYDPNALTANYESHH
jgi:hypothetical protein